MPDNLLTPSTSGQLTTELQSLVDEAEEVLRSPSSANTERTYASAWRVFESWCAAQALQAFPASPQVVALYLTALARTKRISTLTVHLTAINSRHETDKPGEDPRVRRLMRNLRRRGRPSEPKQYLSAEHAARIVAALNLTTLAGVRDRAVLLLGMALGTRRSELAALDTGDVTEAPEGLRVSIRRSKTDQEGEGEVFGVPRAPVDLICPVQAIHLWREVAQITQGPLFRAIDRHGRLGARMPATTVSRIVKEGVASLGLDPTRYGGHSLRSGFATSAAHAGVEERHIQRRLRHASVKMTRRYVQEGTLFIDNPARPIFDAMAKALMEDK